VNEYKIHFLALIQVPVSAVMFPDEKSKYSGVTKPEKLLNHYFSLNKTFDNLPE
jgi:hypothetical protein